MTKLSCFCGVLSRLWREAARRLVGGSLEEMVSDGDQPAVVGIRRNLLFPFMRWHLLDIQAAYELAIEGIAARRAAAEAVTRDRWGLTADDVPPIYDDETGRAPEFWEMVGDIEREMDAAAAHVRIAFLMTLFHAFERQTRRLTKSTHYDHQATMTIFGESGIAIDENKLRELRLAANAAKHGEGVSLDDLRLARPDLVEEDAVVVSAEQLEEFFEVFRRMGVDA